MLEIPDTLHNVVAILLVAVLLGIGWSAGSWLWGLLPLWGRIVAVVIIAILAVLLFVGRV